MNATTEKTEKSIYETLFTPQEMDEYSHLMTIINCTEWGDTEENNIRINELDSLLEKREIELLSGQLDNSDKFHRVNSENDKLFVIGIFDDYQDCINMNEKSESNCYRDLIILNGKTPIC